MAAPKHVDVVEVRIWGQTVGAVAHDPGRNAFVFEYDRKWDGGRIDLAPIKMPLKHQPPVFSFPGLDREAFQFLPGLLADALPDRFGNRLIDAWMERHGVASSNITALDRLSYMGKRGMGALEFRPARATARASSAPIDMANFVEAARRVVAGTIHDDDQSANTLSRIIAVGTSAGGARPKAVLGWNRKTDELISGQFDLSDGFEHWLLKFDGVGEDQQLGPSQQYGRIEYSYYKMATEAGIVMSPCELLKENGRAHFITKRFDRLGNEKVHVQTLSALTHTSHNDRQANAYEGLFRVAIDLGLNDESLNQLFRRMAFNVAARNHDDHTKNFSFLMREGGAWELSPAYDVTFAFVPDNIWLKEHLMSVAGKFDGIQTRDLMKVAERFSVPGAKKAIDDVNMALKGWSHFAHEAGIRADEVERIGQLHQML